MKEENMSTLLDRVPTPQGEVIVITKTNYLFFFQRPRTSVMPMGLSDFGRRIGFQARYKTSDPGILADFHQYFVLMVAAGGFEPLMAGAKIGFVDFPPEYAHLREHIIGFNA